MTDKYEDIMITPDEAESFLARIGIVDDMLERYLTRFIEEPHSSVHKVVALALISCCGSEAQNLGEIYYAVRDLADRMDPNEDRRIGKSRWELLRDAAVIKTGISESEYELSHPRDLY